MNERAGTKTYPVLYIDSHAWCNLKRENSNAGGGKDHRLREDECPQCGAAFVSIHTARKWYTFCHQKRQMFCALSLLSVHLGLLKHL